MIAHRIPTERLRIHTMAPSASSRLIQRGVMRHLRALSALPQRFVLHSLVLGIAVVGAVAVAFG